MTMTTDRYPLSDEGARRISAWHEEARAKGLTFEDKLKAKDEAVAKGMCRDCIHHKAETPSNRCKPCQDDRDEYYEGKVALDAQGDWD